MAIALALALVSAASAQPGEFVKGVLQPLADGFPKRTETIPGLTFRVVDGATVSAAHKTILEFSDPIIHTIGLHIDDKK
jgi:hypothetical protein